MEHYKAAKFLESVLEVEEQVLKFHSVVLKMEVLVGIQLEQQVVIEL